MGHTGLDRSGLPGTGRGMRLRRPGSSTEGRGEEGPNPWGLFAVLGTGIGCIGISLMVKPVRESLYAPEAQALILDLNIRLALVMPFVLIIATLAGL